MKVDPLAVIEAAYRVDLEASEWLAGIGQLVYAQMGAGLGVMAFDYQITDDDRVQPGTVAWERDMPPGVAAAMRGNSVQLPDWFVRETYARCDADTASQGGGSERVREAVRKGLASLKQLHKQAYGWHDIFIVSGVDPTRHGVYFGTWLDKEHRLSPRVRETWKRIAVHLAIASRLRRRLSPNDARTPDSADAVLTPDGRVEHASADARSTDARRDLRDAVVRIEHARTELRDRASDAAVESWRGLASGRWTLVDHFETAGRRYVLARRNDVPAEAITALTAREQQALKYAALGHSNKLIGYELGIAASTVGVLLHRASQKLGTTTRDELVAKFVKLSAVYKRM
jgi:DNA-binding CsgD family transcriptional regulator